MVLITPDDGPSGLTTSIRSLERQLADMRHELEAKYERLRAGDLSHLKDGAKATAEIRQWLKIALEAEVQLEKHRKKENIMNSSLLNIDPKFKLLCRFSMSGL